MKREIGGAISLVVATLLALVLWGCAPVVPGSMGYPVGMAPMGVSGAWTAMPVAAPMTVPEVNAVERPFASQGQMRPVGPLTPGVPVQASGYMGMPGW